MIAGGVGVTPLRAILEELPPSPGAVTFLYREGTPEEVIFRAELAPWQGAAAPTCACWSDIAARRSCRVDPLAPESLGRLVPDIATADVLVCGSRLLHRTHAGQPPLAGRARFPGPRRTLWVLT